MDTQLLEQARQIKARADGEQALLDKLPELERQAAMERQAAEVAQKMQLAQQMFNEAIEAHKQRDSAFESQYKELRSAFRSFVALLKADSRSYENIAQAAYSVAYYIAMADEWGLDRNNVERFQEQVLINSDIKPVTLPQPKDGIDDYFNIAIQEALKVP